MKITVSDNTAEQRYEARADGNLAGFIQYEIRDREIAMVHTQVEDAYEGKGVGSILVKGALGKAGDAGLAVLPYCPFVADYLKRHADYQDLVPAQRRTEFELPEAGRSS